MMSLMLCLTKVMVFLLYPISLIIVKGIGNEAQARASLTKAILGLVVFVVEHALQAESSGRSSLLRRAFTAGWLKIVFSKTFMTCSIIDGLIIVKSRRNGNMFSGSIMLDFYTGTAFLPGQLSPCSWYCFYTWV